MFWKVFAVLCLISASYFGYNHLRLAKEPSVIEVTNWVEKSSGGTWYRVCGRHGGVQVVCTQWAKAIIKK